jgi:hypothetical protein
MLSTELKILPALQQIHFKDTDWWNGSAAHALSA